MNKLEKIKQALKESCEYVIDELGRGIIPRKIFIDETGCCALSAYTLYKQLTVEEDSWPYQVAANKLQMTQDETGSFLVGFDKLSYENGYQFKMIDECYELGKQLHKKYVLPSSSDFYCR